MAIGGLLSSIFNRRYTIQDIMNIDSDRASKAAGITVNLIDIYHEVHKETLLEKFKKLFYRTNDSINIYNIILKFETISPNKSRNTVIVKTYPDFNGSNYYNNPIEVYCSCEDFKFRAAWNLNKHDNIFLSDRTKMKLGLALSQSPKPGYRTTMSCKHLYAVLNWLSNNYLNLMRSL